MSSYTIHHPTVLNSYTAYTQSSLTKPLTQYFPNAYFYGTHDNQSSSTSEADLSLATTSTASSASLEDIIGEEPSIGESCLETTQKGEVDWNSMYQNNLALTHQNYEG